MRNVSDIHSKENQNRNFMFSKFFFEFLAIYMVMWKNMVEAGRQQMIV